MRPSSLSAPDLSAPSCQQPCSYWPCGVRGLGTVCGAGAEAVTSASPPGTDQNQARPGEGCTRPGPPPSVDGQEVRVHPSCPGQRHFHPRTADPFPGSDSGHLSQRVTQTMEAAGPGHRWSPGHRQAWQSCPRKTGSLLSLSRAKDQGTRAVGARGHPILPHLSAWGPSTIRGHLRFWGQAGLLAAAGNKEARPRLAPALRPQHPGRAPHS